MNTRGIIISLAALALALGAAGCGGSSYDSPTSPTTTGNGTSTTASVAVNIVATSGAQSFNPNPASQMQGGTVAWRNGDGAVHRIVANDGSFDTGDIGPGSTSRAVSAPTAGVNYHCSIHPSMVGAIGTASGQPPPACTGPYCD